MVCEDTLRVRNIPKELSETEIQDMLSHFGATKVKVIISKTKPRCVAFAKFDTKEIAKNVMLRLHQMTILNSRLCVEYAEHDIGQTRLEPHSLGDIETSNSKHFKTFMNKLNAFNSAVAFYQPPPPHLKYVYPKPNRATINNMAHALSSVPKFYTQVLHLMNKMNLPPPFSNVPDPPNTLLRHNIAQINHPLKTDVQPTVENADTSESELSSDSENANKTVEIIPAKRNLSQKKSVKRPKFIKPQTHQANTSSKTSEKAEDVFEKVNMHTHSKIELKLTTESLSSLTVQSDNKIDALNEQNGDDKNKHDVITEEELNKNRIPLKDLSILPIFKDYHPGAPTSKLYIKNIAKNAELSDLEYIYKRYIGEVSEDIQNEFDIRLMKEGRMKGQAFVTLNSVELAQKALKETNGYVIKDKPLVVVFAKSSSTKTK